jgi:DNA-binding PadR family transcriptional regulator
MLRFALLGLLAIRPRHGYDLKGAFEALLAYTWPINVGQVYSTLARLERDGLVRCREVVVQDALPDRRVYDITELGQKELERWLEAPATLIPPARQELVLKLLVQPPETAIDRQELIWRQRQVLLEVLADLEQLHQQAADATERLVLEASELQVNAFLTWLDRVEDTFGAPSDPR